MLSLMEYENIIKLLMPKLIAIGNSCIIIRLSDVDEVLRHFIQENNNEGQKKEQMDEETK